MNERPPGDPGDEGSGGHPDDDAEGVGFGVGPGDPARPSNGQPGGGFEGSSGRDDPPAAPYLLNVRQDAPLARAPTEQLVPDGPISRQVAVALLDRGAELMAAGDYPEAASYYRRVVGFDDPAVTAAALLGVGEALYRLDREGDAVSMWERVLQLPETPATYAAWRNVAAAYVREGNLGRAISAYHEADRRAPPSDKAEIASRLGWLSKQSGDRRAAQRYFSRARGDLGVPLSVVVIAITSVISLVTYGNLAGDSGAELLARLALDKPAVANGEIWRLWTVTLVHDPSNLLHLLFNMYALWLAGPIVEQLYGRSLFLVFYLISAAAGSLGSYVFGTSPLGVGASGAIFGLFGVILAATRTHHPVLDRQGRMFVSQIGGLIIFNIAFGFLFGSLIDNFAHLGGLGAGLWLGFVIPPGRVATLRSMWQQTAEQGGPGAAAVRVLGIAALAVVLVAAYIVGTGHWSHVPDPFALVRGLVG